MRQIQDCALAGKMVYSETGFVERQSGFSATKKPPDRNQEAFL
jgi:hypothetical protein